MFLDTRESEVSNLRNEQDDTMTLENAAELFAYHIAAITTEPCKVDVMLGAAHGVYTFECQEDGVPRPTDRATNARGEIIGSRVTARNEYACQFADVIRDLQANSND